MLLLRILVTFKRQKPGGKNTAHRRGCTNDPQWWGWQRHPEAETVIVVRGSEIDVGEGVDADPKVDKTNVGPAILEVSQDAVKGAVLLDEDAKVLPVRHPLVARDKVERSRQRPHHFGLKAPSRHSAVILQKTNVRILPVIVGGVFDGTSIFVSMNGWYVNVVTLTPRPPRSASRGGKSVPPPAPSEDEGEGGQREKSLYES